MDFNELKKKYSPQSGPARQEPPLTQPIPEPVVEPMPEPVAEQIPAPSRPTRTARTKPAAPAKSAVPTLDPAERVMPPEPVRMPQDDEISTDLAGFFGGGEAVPVPEKPRRRSGPRFPVPQGGGFMDRLATLPWVDIIMILLTIAGVAWVVANFDAVTLIIAAAIGWLLQSLIGLFLIVCAIVAAVLIFSRRGRRFW